MPGVAVSEQSGGLRRYGDVLAFPGVARVVAAALIGRLPIGMTPLATVLLLRGEGRSYAVAGIVVAASSLASAAGSPLFGRLVDRTGQSRVLLWLAFVFPAALTALVLLAAEDAPVVALVVVSALAGATNPPLGACMRALWPELVSGPGLRDTAYAFEAWVQEVFFVGGPLIVAAVASLLVPWVAMMTAAALALVGTAWFALAPAVRAIGASPRSTARGGALASQALRTVLVSSFAAGIAFGVVEVLMPAFGEAHGSRSQGGLALASFACGSLIGGIWIGTRPPARRLGVRFAASLGLLGVALLPPLVAPSLPVMCVLMVIAGLPIAPAFAASYGLVDELGIPGTTTEGFAWLTTAIVAGIALGTSGAGAAIDPLGITGALALAAPCAGVAALASFLRLDSLSMPERVP
jgi:MFS family permease